MNTLLPPLQGEVGEQSEPGGVVCADLPAVRRGITPQSPCGDSSPGRGAKTLPESRGREQRLINPMLKIRQENVLPDLLFV